MSQEISQIPGLSWQRWQCRLQRRDKSQLQWHPMEFLYWNPNWISPKVPEIQVSNTQIQECQISENPKIYNDGNADCRGVIKVNCNGTQWNPNSIRPKVAETSKCQIHKYKNTKYQKKLKNRNIQRLQCKLRCDKSQLNRSHSVVNIFVHKNSESVYHGFWGILKPNIKS